jgi:hypothetical protein
MSLVDLKFYDIALAQPPIWTPPKDKSDVWEDRFWVLDRNPRFVGLTKCRLYAAKLGGCAITLNMFDRSKKFRLGRIKEAFRVHH